MALAFTDSAGNLFNLLGRYFGGIELTNNFRGSGANSLGQTVVAVQSELASSNTELINGIYAELATWRGGAAAPISSLAARAQTGLIAIVHADAVLTDLTLAGALRELIRQMDIQAATVKPNVVSAAVAADVGNGDDASVVITLSRPDGRTNELAIPETLDLVCVADAQNDGAVAGQETYDLRGEQPVINALEHNWPGGSGIQAQRTAIDATAGSLVDNGSFDAQTDNVPDDWVLPVGTAGTTIETEDTTVFKAGGKAVKFIGDAGGTLTAIVQTLEGIIPNTVYHFSCRVRKDATLAAGSLEVSLVNGSNAYIENDQEEEIKVAIAHGAISSSAWTEFKGALVTPKQLPGTVKIRVRVSVALTDEKFALVDHLSLAVAEPAYTGGPYVTVHSGSSPAIRGDLYSLTVNNNHAGKFQTFFDRAFNLRELGLQLPSVGGDAETISDSLVTIATA